MISKTSIIKGILTVLLFAISIKTDAQKFSYKEEKEFKDFPDYVMDAFFSPFGNYFVVTLGNNTTILYDKNYNILWQHQGNPQSLGSHVAFSPDENYLAIAKYKSNSDIGILYIPEMEIRQVLHAHEDMVNNVAFNHRGNMLASASSDKKVIVWLLEEEEFKEFQTIEHHNRPVQGLGFSYDDRFLASVGQSRNLVLYELKNNRFEFLQETPMKYWSEGIAFHPLRYELAIGTSGFLRIYSYTGKEFALTDSITDYSGSKYAVNYSPKGNYLTATSMYGHIYIWKYENNKYNQTEVIRRHTACSFYSGFSSDGKYITTAAKDGKAIIWKTEGIEPSDKALICEYYAEPLTIAQRNALTLDVQSRIIKSISPALSKPKGEFETTAQYNDRIEKLNAQVKQIIQQETEKYYGIKIKPKENLAIITNIAPITYNADLQLYSIKFLDITAKVSMNIEEAQTFKEKADKAEIHTKRKLSKDNTSFVYDNFTLIHPANKKEYKIIINDNPLSYNKDRNIDSENTTLINKNTEVASKDTLNIGKTYVLLFASNDYEYFTDLTNPIPDAEAIAKELKENYNAQTELITNASLNETMKKIREYATYNYQKYDQLLIFFAGHGNYDEIFKEGYVLSVNSKPGDDAKTTQLAHSNLRTIVNNIPCEHILLIMDVCFGGTFDPAIASRGGEIYNEASKTEFIMRKLKFKTRLYITSGGKEYVPDGRPGYHSPFARKLLEALRTYGGEDGILTISEIISHIEKVIPEPRAGEFGDNAPGSDFLLIAR